MNLDIELLIAINCVLISKYVYILKIIMIIDYIFLIAKLEMNYFIVVMYMVIISIIY